MQNNIIQQNDVYCVNHGWLESRHVFSFADYFDPQNVSFWNLRVFNDDIIYWKSGFPMHPHANMEILTIVLEGEVSHKDSMWNKGKTLAGEIQTMTAWRGILHSEFNDIEGRLHLYQIWFLPKEKNLTPDYQNYSIELKKNILNLLASNDKKDNIGFLNADVKVMRGQFEAQESFSYHLRENKGLFIYLYKWSLWIDGNILSAQDHLRFEIPWTYTFVSNDNLTDFVLIEVQNTVWKILAKK